MTSVNRLLAGTLLLSGATNLALISDVSRIDKKTDDIINEINRANLIATLYVLKEKQLKNFKEETKMKKINIGSKWSNRTKVMGTMTLLLTAATAVSVIRDNKEASNLDAPSDIPETIGEGLSELADSAVEAVEEFDV